MQFWVTIVKIPKTSWSSSMLGLSTSLTLNIVMVLKAFKTSFNLITCFMWIKLTLTLTFACSCIPKHFEHDFLFVNVNFSIYKEIKFNLVDSSLSGYHVGILIYERKLQDCFVLCFYF